MLQSHQSSGTHIDNANAEIVIHYYVYLCCFDPENNPKLVLCKHTKRQLPLRSFKCLPSSCFHTAIVWSSDELTNLWLSIDFICNFTCFIINFNNVTVCNLYTHRCKQGTFNFMSQLKYSIYCKTLFFRVHLIFASSIKSQN